MEDQFGYKAVIQQQQSFFKTGATLSPEFRIAMLKKLYWAVIHNEKKIAAALKADLGKSLHEVITTEIGQVTAEIKYLIKHVRRYTGKKLKPTNLLNIPSKSYVIREPYGVTLIMGPWNYPFQLLMSPLAAAIAGGNCAVVKPSEISSHTSKVIEDMLKDIYDDAYISVVQGGIEETTALLAQRFDKIFFTGSPKVGSIVMESAAKHLTPVILELGGKSPCVIDKKTKLNVAVRRVLFGKSTNAGQTCVAPDYVLVHEAIADAFYAEFKRTAEQMFNHEYEDNNDFGRIINLRNYERLVSMLDDGEVVYGGGHNKEKLHIDLTLVKVENLESTIMNEEIFGPILPVVTYKAIDEVVEIIERNPDPLAMYIFSDDQEVVDTLLTRVPFGGGCVNDTLLHLTNEYLPFGGRGTSGMGNYHGPYSIEAFTHEKAILHGRTFFDLMIKYPPYKAKTVDFLRKIMY